MYHIFFNHSSVDRHLGCFSLLAIVNSAAMNMGGRMCLLHTDFIYFDKQLVMKLLDHMAIVFFIF
jgi:hypothetical protein